MEIARHLAAKENLAVLRFDWVHLGDSSWHGAGATAGDDATAQAVSAAAFAMRATGTDRFATIGACLGARIGLQMAAEIPSCVATVAISPHVYAAPRPARRRIPAAAARVGRLIRGLTRGYEVDEKFPAWVRDAAASCEVLILTGAAPNRWGKAASELLGRIVYDLPLERRRNLVLRHRPDLTVSGFPSPEAHRYALDEATACLARAFSPREVPLEAR